MMGTIIGCKATKDGKLIYEVLMDYEESLQLKGNMKNINLYSEDTAEMRANVSARGKNGATKYFLIPRELRENIKIPKNAKCQKLETKTKTTFIYTIDTITI